SNLAAKRRPRNGRRPISGGPVFFLSPFFLSFPGTQGRICSWWREATRRHQALLLDQLASRQVVAGSSPSSAPSCNRTGSRSPSIAVRNASSSGFTVLLSINIHGHLLFGDAGPTPSMRFVSAHFSAETGRCRGSRQLKTSRQASKQLRLHFVAA